MGRQTYVQYPHSKNLMLTVSRATSELCKLIPEDKYESQERIYEQIKNKLTEISKLIDKTGKNVKFVITVTNNIITLSVVDTKTNFATTSFLFDNRVGKDDKYKTELVPQDVFKLVGKLYKIVIASIENNKSIETNKYIFRIDYCHSSPCYTNYHFTPSNYPALMTIMNTNTDLLNVISNDFDSTKLI